MNKAITEAVEKLNKIADEKMELNELVIAFSEKVKQFDGKVWGDSLRQKMTDTLRVIIEEKCPLIYEANKIYNGTICVGFYYGSLDYLHCEIKTSNGEESLFMSIPYDTKWNGEEKESNFVYYRDGNRKYFSAEKFNKLWTERHTYVQMAESIREQATNLEQTLTAYKEVLDTYEKIADTTTYDVRRALDLEFGYLSDSSHIEKYFKED